MVLKDSAGQYSKCSVTIVAVIPLNSISSKVLHLEILGSTMRTKRGFKRIGDLIFACFDQYRVTGIILFFVSIFDKRFAFIRFQLKRACHPKESLFWRDSYYTFFFSFGGLSLSEWITVRKAAKPMILLPAQAIIDNLDLNNQDRLNYIICRDTVQIGNLS